MKKALLIEDVQKGFVNNDRNLSYWCLTHPL